MSTITEEQIKGLTEAQWRQGSAVLAEIDGSPAYLDARRRALGLRDKDTEADHMAGRQPDVFNRWATLRKLARASAPEDLSAIQFVNQEPCPPVGPPSSLVGYAFLAQEYADSLTESEQEILTRGWKAAQAT